MCDFGLISTQELEKLHQLLRIYRHETRDWCLDNKKHADNVWMAVDLELHSREIAEGRRV